MKFFPRRKRQKSLPRSKSRKKTPNQDRQWTIHPHNQKSLPGTTGPTSTTSSPTSKPSNITIYTPPDSDVLHIDDSQHGGGRWSAWHKMALFVCFVAFASLLWGYAGILNRSKPTEQPLIIQVSPSPTHDAASAAQMNATSTAVLSDAQRHHESNSSLIQATSTSDAINTGLQASSANATATSDTVNAILKVSSADATEAIQQAHVDAKSTVIASRAALEQKKIEIESKELDDIHEETSERRENTTAAQGVISMAMSGTGILGLASAVVYLLINSKPLMTGLSSLKRPTVATMTNSGSKQPIRQPKPTRPLPTSNQKPKTAQTPKLRTDSPIDFLKTAHRMMIVGVTGTGKTTIATALAATRKNCVAIDPKPRTKWGNHVRVVGRGYEDDDVTSELARLMNEMKSRSKRMIESEDYMPDDLFIFLDEWPYLVSLDGAKDTIIKLILQGREFGMYVVLLTQSDDVKTLGISGQGQLRESFVIVRLKNTRGKRTAHIVWGDDEYTFVIPKLDKRPKRTHTRNEIDTPSSSSEVVIDGDFEAVQLSELVQSLLPKLAEHISNGGVLSIRKIVDSGVANNPQARRLLRELKDSGYTKTINKETRLTLAGQQLIDAQLM